MKFERTVFNLDIYGEKFTVNKMTAYELNEYQKKLLECEDVDAMDVTLKMLVKQGIPKKISEKMEMPHLNDLVMAVCGTSTGK